MKNLILNIVQTVNTKIKNFKTYFKFRKHLGFK